MTKKLLLSKKIGWAEFTFRGLNLWNAPPSPEMLQLHKEIVMTQDDGMTRFDLPLLEEFSRAEYEELKASGMLWEYYPGATGTFEIDCCGE